MTLVIEYGEDSFFQPFIFILKYYASYARSRKLRITVYFGAKLILKKIENLTFSLLFLKSDEGFG